MPVQKQKQVADILDFYTLLPPPVLRKGHSDWV